MRKYLIKLTGGLFLFSLVALLPTISEAQATWCNWIPETEMCGKSPGNPYCAVPAPDCEVPVVE